MEKFNIKDLLIHILHGGIILLTIVAVHHDCKISDIFSTISKSSIFIAACYLVGLFIDPVADCVDTFLINHTKCFNKLIRLPFFPSYYFLKFGECCGLKLAHNVKVRYILNNDAIENETFEGQKGGTIKGANKKKLWNNLEDIKLLFNYAKNRAFVCAKEYQLNRLKNYFQLFIFYRNMMYTSTVSLIALLFATGKTLEYKILIIISIPILIRLFYIASYKYRAYYCRMILGCVYNGGEHITRGTHKNKLTVFLRELFRKHA